MKEIDSRKVARRFSELYPKMSDVSLRRLKGEKVASILHDALQGRRASRVLDVGCSNAHLLDVVTARLSVDHAIGVDMDRAALPVPAPGRSVVLADAMRLPIVSGCMDVVICNHIYEHVPDPRLLFREIHRCLKPGGIVYFSAMNARWPIEPHHHVPFLHWIPRRLAGLILTAIGRTGGYSEKPLGTRGLRRLVAPFEVVDYTLRVIREPERFHAVDMIPRSWWRPILAAAAPWVYGILPGYIWVLRKDPR